MVSKTRLRTFVDKCSNIINVWGQFLSYLDLLAGPTFRAYAEDLENLTNSRNGSWKPNNNCNNDNNSVISATRVCFIFYSLSLLYAGLHMIPEMLGLISRYLLNKLIIEQRNEKIILGKKGYIYVYCISDMLLPCGKHLILLDHLIIMAHYK